MSDSEQHDVPVDPNEVPDTPNTDPASSDEAHATGEEQAQENRDREPPA